MKVTTERLETMRRLAMAELREDLLAAKRRAEEWDAQQVAETSP